MQQRDKKTQSEHIPIVIIGAGFGGLAQAYYFNKAGIRDFAIFERADELGGT